MPEKVTPDPEKSRRSRSFGSFVLVLLVVLIVLVVVGNDPFRPVARSRLRSPRRAA